MFVYISSKHAGAQPTQPVYNPVTVVPPGVYHQAPPPPGMYHQAPPPGMYPQQAALGVAPGPQNTVVVQGGFDAGARFVNGQPPSVPVSSSTLSFQ